jgi:D-alanine transaminase
MQLSFEERAFTPQEAMQAAEAFVTASSQIVMPVVMIDGHAIGDGKPGTITRRLRQEFHRFAMFS